MILVTGLEKIEGFLLPDNWKIITDYLYSPSGSSKDISDVYKGRANGNLRRSKLFKDGVLVSEAIETNPHYLSSEEINKLINNGEFIGEEFDRTINFPNGYVAKIEYWNSKDDPDSNQGIYSSKYRRMILLNENNHVIFDILQDNNNFGKTPYTKDKKEWYKHSKIL